MIDDTKNMEPRSNTMKKTTRSAVLVTAIALTMSAASLFAADRVRTGQWEVTSTNDGKARIFKSCLRAEEASAVNGDAKGSRAYLEKLTGQCKFSDYKVEGNTISTVMTCGGSTVRTTTTYHGDSYQSDATTKTGSAPEVISHITAKRLGDCP
jgi:hypothetical protein